MLTSTALTPGHQPVPGTCVPSKVGNRVWPLKDAEYQPGVVGGVGGGGGGGEQQRALLQGVQQHSWHALFNTLSWRALYMSIM